MNYSKKLLFIALLGFIPLMLSLSCDGGGESNTQNTQITLINGQITNITASAQKKEKSFKMTLLDLITFIKEARAQGGTLVTAIVDGVIVASDVTDPQGNFTLSLDLESASNVLIQFDVNGSEVFIEIVAEEGSILNITVSIDLNAPPGDEVEIVEMEDVIGAIRCETGNSDIIKGFNDTVVIDGGGEACIRTEGNCTIFIEAQDITLTNCEQCVDARGTSEVMLISPFGNIFCEANEDGFKTVGNAEVLVEANETVEIIAGENGLKADGNSRITLDANTCIIDSLENPIDTNGNVVIDTSGCGEIIEGPTPSPFPSPEPTDEPS